MPGEGAFPQAERKEEEMEGRGRKENGK